MNRSAQPGQRSHRCYAKTEQSDDDAESDFWALEDVYWEWTLGEEDEETLRAESASSDE